MCESLWTTSEVTDDQEKMHNFFQQNKLMQSRCLAMHRRFLCSVKSGFTTLANKRALHIISTPSVLHGHAQASKALPEFLKVVLKHVTERLNFIRTRACFFKVRHTDELTGLQC